MARSSAEIGLLLTTLVLICGSLWAKPIWGIWWSWDARLTTTLLLWFIYVGYLMLRSSVDDDRRGARYAAVLGIVGFVDIPIIHQSVVWWRSLHPEPIVTGVWRPGDAADMLLALAIALFAFTVLYACLLRLRCCAPKAAPGGSRAATPDPRRGRRAMEGNLVYLFAALALTWIIIIGYLLVLGGGRAPCSAS